MHEQCIGCARPGRVFYVAVERGRVVGPRGACVWHKEDVYRQVARMAPNASVARAPERRSQDVDSMGVTLARPTGERLEGLGRTRDPRGGAS